MYSYSNFLQTPYPPYPYMQMDYQSIYNQLYLQYQNQFPQFRQPAFHQAQQPVQQLNYITISDDEESTPKQEIPKPIPAQPIQCVQTLKQITKMLDLDQLEASGKLFDCESSPPLPPPKQIIQKPKKHLSKQQKKRKNKIKQCPAKRPIPCIKQVQISKDRQQQAFPQSSVKVRLIRVYERNEDQFLKLYEKLKLNYPLEMMKMWSSYSIIAIKIIQKLSPLYKKVVALSHTTSIPKRINKLMKLLLIENEFLYKYIYIYKLGIINQRNNSFRCKVLKLLTTFKSYFIIYRLNSISKIVTKKIIYSQGRIKKRSFLFIKEFFKFIQFDNQLIIFSMHYLRSILTYLPHSYQRFKAQFKSRLISIYLIFGKYINQLITACVKVSAYSKYQYITFYIDTNQAYFIYQFMILTKLKSLNFWYINRNWTMKNQILMVSFIIWTIIFTIMIVTISQTQNYIQDNLKSISNEIFIKQTSQQLNNIWIYKQSMERMFQFTQRQIYSTRRIYKYFDNLEHNSKVDKYFENPHMCLNNETEVDSFCFKYSTTCGIFGVPMNNKLTQEAESIIALTFILTSFRIALDHTNSAPLYYFLDNDSLFYCITTGIPFPKTFVPNKRPYYFEFKQKISNDSSLDNVYFASPYQVVSGKIRIPLMISLVDYKDNIVGMVAKDIDFGYASVSSNSNKNTTLYVIDNQGKIFYSLLYNQVNLSVYYFNDSDVTGFDTNDFVEIMNNHNGLPFQNNCQNQQNSEILCRYNSKVKDNLIIKSTQLANSPLILIVLIETNTVQQQSEDHFNLQKELQQTAVQEMVIIIACMPSAIILISQIIIYLVLKQLNLLIDLVRQSVYQNKREYYFSFLKQESLFQSDVVSGLIIAYTKLFNCIISVYKTDECKKQESIKYPKFLRSHLRMKERLTSKIRFINDQLRDKVNYKGFEFRFLISFCALI